MSFARLLAEGRVRADVGLGALTTYHLGGPASLLLDAATSEDLIAASRALAEDPHPVLALGRGSNLVVSERGFDGLVVRLGAEFGNINFAEGRVTAGGIVPLPQIARTVTAAGGRGLEFLIGVPGSTGGGVRQNAGGFGFEMADVLEVVEVFDFLTGETVEVAASSLDLAYRHSRIASTDLVVRATMRAGEGDPSEGLELIRDHTRWRRLHQPGGTLNAGSVFKNPPGDSAGRIIDSLGLKGMRLGGAEVSAKHANFFVAMPGTAPSHVYLLVKEVAEIVANETGIELEPEIQFIGDFEGLPEG